MWRTTFQKKLVEAIVFLLLTNYGPSWDASKLVVQAQEEEEEDEEVLFLGGDLLQASASITIERSIDDVFAYIANPLNDPAWRPEVQMYQVHNDDNAEPPYQEGQTFTETINLGALVPFGGVTSGDSILLEYDAPTRAVWTSLPDQGLTFYRTFESQTTTTTSSSDTTTSSSSTRVQLRLVIGNDENAFAAALLRLPLFPFLWGVELWYSRHLRQSLARVRAILEMS